MAKNKRVTIKDIAEDVGVSVSLVSRVLSGKAQQIRVSDTTKRAVLDAARKRGYSANIVARGLRLQKTNTIALVVTNITNDFFSNIARHIEAAARNRGYAIVLCDSQEDSEIEKICIKKMRDHMVDGFIVAPNGLECDHLVRLYEDHFPIVCLDGYFPGRGLPYVVSDHFGGARQGAAYLLERGHREIVYLQGYPYITVSEDRLRGFKTALDDYQVKFRKSMVAGDIFSMEGCYWSTLDVLKRKNRPTALLSASNVNTLGALQAIQEMGLHIPDDISLVSFDELSYSPFLMTPLTTVAHRQEELGRHAIDQILKQIKGVTKGPLAEIVVPTDIVERASVRDLQAQPA